MSQRSTFIRNEGGSGISIQALCRVTPAARDAFPRWATRPINYAHRKVSPLGAFLEEKNERALDGIISCPSYTFPLISARSPFALNLRDPLDIIPVLPVEIRLDLISSESLLSSKPTRFIHPLFHRAQVLCLQRHTVANRTSPVPIVTNALRLASPRVNPVAFLIK